VVEEVVDPILDRSILSMQAFTDFRNAHCNDFVEIGTPDKPKSTPLGQWWLTHSKRRQYERVVFSPEHDVPGAYNLWTGFSCEARPGDCGLFLEHLRQNICGGNEEYYNYLLGWVARLVQKPASPGQVAVVLRGDLGTGKGFFVSQLGSLFGRHYLQVSNPQHLVGQFNVHLRDCLLLFGDEAFYAGDKKHESVLKTLTTELGLDDMVTFTGRVPHEQIEDYYSVVDVAPFPRKSLPVTEMVSPLKPFEAMAMEKVVVASDVAALKEIVIPGVNGFLFEKDNVESLADTLELALAEVGKKNLTPREWAIENRSWEKIAARAANLYSELAARQPNENRGLKQVSMLPEVVAVLKAFRERFDADQKHHLRRDDFARFSCVLERVVGRGGLGGATLSPQDDLHETSLLDIGVGTGQFLNICAERGTFNKLRGVDIKPHGSFVTLREGSFDMDYVSIEKLPYDDGEFDVVTCLEVIEHLPESIFVPGIEELRRVCGKQLIISVPFRERVLARDHKRRFYLEDLERLFPNAEISFLRKINKIEGRESCWAVVVEDQQSSSS